MTDDELHQSHYVWHETRLRNRMKDLWALMDLMAKMDPGDLEREFLYLQRAARQRHYTPVFGGFIHSPEALLLVRRLHFIVDELGAQVAMHVRYDVHEPVTGGDNAA